MQIYRHILHPTDLLSHSRVAFLHALRLSIGALTQVPEAELDLLHCARENDLTASQRFPRAQDILTGWGVLPTGASLSKIGLRVRQELCAQSPQEEIARVSQSQHAELLVMATRSRAEFSQVLRESVSIQALQKSHLPGLLLPNHESGFVQERTGQVALKRVLLPVVKEPSPQPARQSAVRLLKTLGSCVSGGGELLEVCVGRDLDFPEGERPNPPLGWKWHRRVYGGEPTEVLTQLAATWKPNLAVMASKGRDSWRDHWFGSTLDQLLNRLHCPILVVPAG